MRPRPYGLGTGRDLSAADAAVEQFRLRHLVRVDLGDSLSAEVDLQRGLDGKTVPYLMAEGVLTAALARTFAAELLTAADMLDGLLQ